MSFINEFREDGNKRLYQRGINKEGDEMLIVEYNGYDDIVVEFQDENACRVHTQYANFVRGSVRNSMKPKHGFHGYIGNGKYKTEGRGENGERLHIQAYESWRKMHLRAENFDGKHPSYEDVTICKEWWNYQNFAEWFEKNYYEVEGEVMCVDKDIKDPFSRCYSPSTCLIVPNCINELFKKMEISEEGLPTGVHRRSDSIAERYRSRTKILDENGKAKIVSKTTKTPEEAFEFYKENKEKYIKQMAEKYKNVITKELYEILMNYEVEMYLH